MPSARRLALAAVTASAIVVTLAPVAGAHGSNGPHKPGWSRTLTTDVLMPFGLALDNQGKVLVADGAKNTVFRLDGSTLTPLAQGLAKPGADVAGVDVADDGSWAYTTSAAEEFTHTAAQLVIKKDGKPDVVADILAYETAKNPDKAKTYGLPAGNDCADGRAWLEQATGGPATYTGLVDSHPYAVASLGHGSWAVADAGANAIFKVDAAGKVSTIAVLPPQKTVLTTALLAAVTPPGAPAAPACLDGLTYGFEAVPTDVELGPLGQLWVSTLPGGPEDPSFGARGSVYLVNPWSGWSTRLATGFAGATNLAVTSTGTVYVAELFGGKITQMTWWGKKSTFKTLESPLAVEVDRTSVYAATLGLDLEAGAPNGKGKIVQYAR